MIDIVPAVLPKNFDELQEALDRLRGVASLVQVDLVGTNILTGREAMPAWEDFDFEFDIMLHDPAAEVETCLAIGPSRIVVHAAAANARSALESLQERRLGEYPVAAGVALRVHDTPEGLSAFEGLYDFVQVMGIEHEGRQGEPFAPAALELVRALRASHPRLFIQVDGHAAGHERALVQAGANRLIVGSAIVQADNPSAAFKEIYTRANGSL